MSNLEIFLIFFIWFNYFLYVCNRAIGEKFDYEDWREWLAYLVAFLILPFIVSFFVIKAVIAVLYKPEEQ